MTPIFVYVHKTNLNIIMAKEERKVQSLQQLRAAFGRPETEFISTGIPQLDDIWGAGKGAPTGKIIEVHSDAGFGKTTVLLHVAKNLIKKGHKVAFLDVEHALEESLLEGVGLMPYVDDAPAPSFLILSPNKFSEVEIAMDHVLSLDYKFIIYDSLTNTVPDRRAAGSITDITPGLKAMLQSVFLEQYKAILSRRGITMFVINQLRTKISFLRTTVEPAGGKALQFNTDIRTGLRKIKWIESTEGGIKRTVGATLIATTIKNKLTLPFREVKFDLLFGKGVDILSSIANLLVEEGHITQSGAYFSVPDADGVLTNVRGREAFKDWIKANQSLVRALIKDTSREATTSDPESNEDFNNETMGDLQDEK